jgi:DNA-binding response OmpR family regulator
LLVADSHDDARAIYVRFLSRFGFQAEPAATAEEVLALVREVRPQVILIEQRLLNLPPWNLARRPETKDVPLIVLSGAVAVDPVGDDGFQPAAILYKPFALASMLETVRVVLRPALPPATSGASSVPEHSWGGGQ